MRYSVLSRIDWGNEGERWHLITDYNTCTNLYFLLVRFATSSSPHTSHEPCRHAVWAQIFSPDDSSWYSFTCLIPITTATSSSWPVKRPSRALWVFVRPFARAYFASATMANFHLTYWTYESLLVSTVPPSFVFCAFGKHLWWQSGPASIDPITLYALWPLFIKRHLRTICIYALLAKTF